MQESVKLTPGKWRIKIKSFTLHNNHPDTPYVGIMSDLDIYCGPYVVAYIRLGNGIMTINQGAVLNITEESNFEFRMISPGPICNRDPALFMIDEKITTEFVIEAVDN